MAELPSQARSRIFVSYQLEAAEPAVTRLLEMLRRHYGVDTVVSSADFTDTPGDQRASAITEALESCHSVIAVAGNNWPSRPVQEDDRSRRARETFELELTAALAQEHIATVLLFLGEVVPRTEFDLSKALAGLAKAKGYAWADPQPLPTGLLSALDCAASIARLIEKTLAAMHAEDFDTAAACVQAASTLDAEREDVARLSSRVNAAREQARRRAEESTRQRPLALDENVQFTVFRRPCVQPGRWYPLLAFAHLAERRPDAPADERDPVAEVQAQAAQVLGPDISQFRSSTEDSASPVMREGELRFVPLVEGVEFNPPERRFLWTESVHREEFRMRASAALDGRVARGALTVYAGNLVLADVQLAIRVDSRVAVAPQERSEARPYRRVFASYSHRDTAIVEEFEAHARALGDQYLRDVVTLRSGEVWTDRLKQLINEADVFQLFWSWNALASAMVRAEWQHALALNRPFFVRPVYWEDPLPEQQGLPPNELRRLHFQRVYPRVAAPVAVGAGTGPVAVPRAAPPPAPPAAAPTPAIPPAARPTPAPAPHDTGAFAPLPRPPRAEAPAPSRPRSVPKARSSLRVMRFAALAAVCVIAASVIVALRPYLFQPASAPPAASPPDQSASAPPQASPGPGAPPPKPPETTTAATPSAAASRMARERSAIGDVMRRYETAWTRKDRAALKEVWAMPPATKERVDAELRSTEPLQVQLRIVSIDVPSDNRARVTAVEERTQKTRGSAVTRRTRQRLVYDLERRDGEWKIVSVNAQPPVR